MKHRLARRLGPTLTAGLLITALSAGAAVACSCVRYESAAQQFTKVEIAFVGRVESQTAATGPYGGGVQTTFAVARTLKGENLPVRVVSHYVDDGGNCGITYQAGQTVLVFAYRSDDGLGTSSCSAPQFPIVEFERLAAGK